MKSEEIHLSDWQRILGGNVPPEFYLELVIRVAIVYLILVVSMRIMGRRMASQLNRSEMVAMASMAASIGVPVMAPDRGIIPAIISAAIIVTIQRIVSRRASKNESFETLVEGDLSILVSEGVMNLGAMQASRIPRARLFSQLRQGGIHNLGAVKYVIMEANGKFTVIKQPQPQPGLLIVPEWDTEFADRFEKIPDISTCKNCGNTGQSSTSQPCMRCGDQNWVPAVH